MRSLHSVQQRQNIRNSRQSMTSRTASMPTTDSVNKLGDNAAATVTARRFRSVTRPRCFDKLKQYSICVFRTTRMLIAVMLLVVIVELPHGILNLITGIYGSEFGVRIYDQLGSFMEMLTLLYSSINFLLYTFMSNQFMHTFRRVFIPCYTNNDNEYVLTTMRHRRRTHNRGVV